MAATKRLQLQLPLPSGRELKDDERVRRHLSRGWRVVQLQRLSDQEVLVTLTAPASDQT